MSLRWKRDVCTSSHLAHDGTGKCVAVVLARRIGQPLRWQVCTAEDTACTGMAPSIPAAKLAAERAYVGLSRMGGRDG